MPLSEWRGVKIATRPIKEARRRYITAQLLEYSLVTAINRQIRLLILSDLAVILAPRENVVCFRGALRGETVGAGGGRVGGG